jgi:hypothetical protein
MTPALPASIRRATLAFTVRSSSCPSNDGLFSLCTHSDLIHTYFLRGRFTDPPCLRCGLTDVDWIFDGPDILYSIRAGYRGSNSFHNANRMAVKRVRNFAALAHPNGSCTNSWRGRYTLVGEGWCRPTEGFQQAGHGLEDADCAQRCTESLQCNAFANNRGLNGGCVLYPAHATAASGLAGIDCFTSVTGAIVGAVDPPTGLKTDDAPSNTAARVVDTLAATWSGPIWGLPNGVLPSGPVTGSGE